MPDKRTAMQFYGAIRQREYAKLGYAIVEVGDYVVDQGGRTTYEVLNANLELKNPLDRIVTHPLRKMNLGFAFAEFLTELIGDSDLATMKAFVGSYDRFSSDGETIDGSYAARLNEPYNGHQLEQIVKILKRDPESRRAVATLYRAYDDLWGGGGKNTPCTLSLQFLLRNNALNLITTMRSNDYYLGLTYDVFNFTMIQEWVARMLNVEVGRYFHNDGSLHVYDTDIAVLSNIDEAPMPWTRTMDVMPIAAAREMERVAEIYSLMAADAAEGCLDHFSNYSPHARTRYCKDILATGFVYLMKKDNPHHAMNVALKIQDETLKYVVLNSFAK